MNWAMDWWGLPTWLYMAIGLNALVLMALLAVLLVHRLRRWRDIQEALMWTTGRLERMSPEARRLRAANQILRMCDEPHMREIVAHGQLTVDERDQLFNR